jgi:hypothetical protein
MTDAAVKFADGAGIGKKVSVDMALFDKIEPADHLLNH